MQRVLIVANRLPVTVKATDSGVDVQRSAGGLATGLLRPHEQSGGLWIGWSGAPEELTAGQQSELDEQLAAMRLVSVPLTADQVTRYYENFSNGVLWPLFHYLLDQVPLHVRDWDAYAEVNELFADIVAEHYRPGDLIWVHDYQLLLLPDLLRKRLPDARIGFFLHIPFPSEELFRTLPQRDRLLRGLLGADLVGFHTPAYLRHFAASITQLGLTIEIDKVQLSDREVRLGVFPMGIDAAAFMKLAEDPAVQQEARALRADESVRNSPAAAVLREDASDPSGAARAGSPGAGSGTLADGRRGISGVSCHSRGTGRPHQRRFRDTKVGPGALHLPLVVGAGAGGAVPRGGRHAGDTAA